MEALIFDMDGVLLESESLWRQAEREVSDSLGLNLGAADFEATMGVRMREVAQIWYAKAPWKGPSTDQVAQRVTDRVSELAANAVPLPGVIDVLGMASAHGYRVGLCTSSDTSLMHTVLNALDLTDTFEVVHSAQGDLHGKPHPMPYLLTAEKLGVDPRRCFAIEDSVAGAVSAKAAGMMVIAVPDRAHSGNGRFGFADLTLASLAQLDHEMLMLLAEGANLPNMSRPRFHRAFTVDDLAAARWFYGEVLGCEEGRSAPEWVDFDLYGHQVVAHLGPRPQEPATNPVDGHQVPAEHSGLLLHRPAWEELVRRLEAEGDRVTWIMKPTTRFAGAPGEQQTCFVLDPAGNALEFKAFRDDNYVFAK